MARPRQPKKRRQAKPRRVATEIGAEKIGDSVVFVFGMGLEMVVAADLLNRLRLAEASVIGEDTYNREEESAGVEEAYFGDMRAALMEWVDIARTLPLDFIRKQRAVWEEEVARIGLALWEPLNERDWARTLYRRARAVYIEGVAAGTKKESIYSLIAEKLFLSEKDKKLSYEARLRKVRRILGSNKKARGGVFDIDKQLFARRPRSLQSIAGHRYMDEPDDAVVSDEEYGPNRPAENRPKSGRTKKPPKSSGRK